MALALALALSLLVLPLGVVIAAALVLAAATVVDALAARRPEVVTRTVGGVLARGVSAPLRIVVDATGAGTTRIRQPQMSDVAVTPAEGVGGLDALVTARRRGRHALAPVAVRRTGPLGLGRWDRTAGEAAEIRVYPDLPAARRIATAVRQGRFRDPGQVVRGPLGLGTDFESVREYGPDDDIRRVNWVATARVGRPMTNRYREDTERNIIALVDCGRLMTSPVGDRTRLDAALDAVAALAAVADAVGDRFGTVAFDSAVRRRVGPRRANGEACLRALFDLEPRPIDSDYELAFASLGTAKRSLVVVCTDLLEEAAARPLLAAVPILVRRHAVIVASSADADLTAMTTNEPASRADVYTAAVAIEVLAARDRVASALVRTGTTVVDAAPDQLAGRCVAAYLRLKSRSRL